MEDENLKKLLEAMKADPEIDKIDEETLDILKKMSTGEIEVDEASEVLLAKKNDNAGK